MSHFGLSFHQPPRSTCEMLRALVLCSGEDFCSNSNSNKCLHCVHGEHCKFSLFIIESDESVESSRLHSIRKVLRNGA